jgi:hypothetical protein
MPGTNVLASELARVVGVVDPDANGAGALSTGWIAMKDYDAILAILMIGTFVATGLADMKLEQATDGSGTGVKDITGKAITQLTQAGSDDDKQALINCRADELDIDNDFTHVRATFTLTTAGADSGVIVLGLGARYSEVADLASVDEIIA